LQPAIGIIIAHILSIIYHTAVSQNRFSVNLSCQPVALHCIVTQPCGISETVSVTQSHHWPHKPLRLSCLGCSRSM